jgi:branched-chain amino acid aminotransferase
MTETINIQVTKTNSSRLASTDLKNPAFGKVYSDHMFIADYENGEWRDFRIEPFRDIHVSPANTTLHYASTIFEGLKAYRSKSNEILVFRPQENARRMIKSAERMCMPPVPESLFMDAMTELLRLDQGWVPSYPETSLYIRPFVIAMDPFIGIRPSDTYTFFIITGPAGAYYNHALRVKVEEQYTRAAQGGTGFAKTGGNYAAALYPTVKAIKEGYEQLIWTDGINHEFIEEAGTMNIMFVIDDTLVTAPAGETILHGITRASIVQLAKDNGMKVEERPIKVTEIIDAIEKGILQEAFGAGTAATITQIKEIGYRGKDYQLPPVEGRKYSHQFLDQLNKVKYGESPDPHNWIYKI